MLNIIEIDSDARTLLHVMAKEDSNFCVPASFPGGIVLANSKRAVRLVGQNMKLGTRFIMTPNDLLKPFAEQVAAAVKQGKNDRRSRELNPQYKGKSKRKGKRS